MRDTVSRDIPNRFTASVRDTQTDLICFAASQVLPIFPGPDRPFELVQKDGCLGSDSAERLFKRPSAIRGGESHEAHQSFKLSSRRPSASRFRPKTRLINANAGGRAG